MQEARGMMQEARGMMQEARGMMQEARGGLSSYKYTKRCALQHTATHCNKLQHTAKRYNTPNTLQPTGHYGSVRSHFLLESPGLFLLEAATLLVLEAATLFVLE